MTYHSSLGVQDYRLTVAELLKATADGKQCLAGSHEQLWQPCVLTLHAGGSL